MFFANTSPAVFRRPVDGSNGFSLERFLQQAQLASNARCLEESENQYTLSLDVPGVSKEQLSIGIEDNVVRVQSKPDAPRSYRWACELPQDIDSGSSQAALENGVLTLHLTKRVQPSRVTELAIS